MLRLVLLIIVIAAVAGYFTKPTEAAMREAASVAVGDAAEDALSNGNVMDAIRGGAAHVSADGVYQDYYVAAKYASPAEGTPLVECWGAFTKVMCNRVGADEEPAPAT